METLNRFMGLLGFLFIVLLFFGSIIITAIAIVSALIVPMTYLWAMFTDRTYASVCDSSDMLFKLNQWGKWSLVILICFLIMWFIF